LVVLSHWQYKVFKLKWFTKLSSPVGISNNNSRFFCSCHNCRQMFILIPVSASVKIQRTNDTNRFPVFSTQSLMRNGSFVSCCPKRQFLWSINQREFSEWFGCRSGSPAVARLWLYFVVSSTLFLYEFLRFLIDVPPLRSARILIDYFIKEFSYHISSLLSRPLVDTRAGSTFSFFLRQFVEYFEFLIQVFCWDRRRLYMITSSKQVPIEISVCGTRKLYNFIIFLMWFSQVSSGAVLCVTIRCLHRGRNQSDTERCWNLRIFYNIIRFRL
jgi:hypothetical protein